MCKNNCTCLRISFRTLQFINVDNILTYFISLSKVHMSLMKIMDILYSPLFRLHMSNNILTHLQVRNIFLFFTKLLIFIFFQFAKTCVEIHLTCFTKVAHVIYNLKLFYNYTRCVNIIKHADLELKNKNKNMCN